MANVELRQLEYFVAVAEHLHFGQAADSLSIGQPAVSQQVARLERQLGVQLFDRTPRRVRLTDSGRRFLPLARTALAAVEKACQVVSQPSEVTAGPLRIGSCSGLGSRLDAFLNALDRLQPGRSVELTHAPRRPRLERVAAGQLDAAFVRGAHGAPDIEMVPLWEDPIVAALPADHPLALLPVAAIGELARLPLRLVARRTSPVLVDLVLGACADAGRAPRRIEHDNGPVDGLLATVASGPPSWTVVYESHARMLNTPRIAFVKTDPPLALPAFLAVAEGASSQTVAPLLEAAGVAGRVAP
jgi:DNA-binding transcriptional LysR family regulator